MLEKSSLLLVSLMTVLFSVIAVAPANAADYYERNCSIFVGDPLNSPEYSRTQSLVECMYNTGTVKTQNHLQRWDGVKWTTLIYGNATSGTAIQALRSDAERYPRHCGILRGSLVVVFPDGAKRYYNSNNVKYCNA